MQDLGKLLLRLCVGGLMLFHGINKINNFESTISYMKSLLVDGGLPDFLAYGVFLGEVLAPGLIIIGLFTRIGGLLVTGTMAMAVYLQHMNELLPPDGSFPVLGKGGAWALEVQAFYFFGGLAIACLGAGRIAIAPGNTND
jgi:putative oxidoreductase